MVIYETVNAINGKKYIGKDSKNNPKYLGSGKYLKLAIKKYGKENFNKNILQYCNSLDELNQAEVEWIVKLNCKNSVDYYNVIDTVTPCRKGRPLSKEHRQKISNSHKGKKHSTETRRKLSLIKKGKKRGKYSVEHRAAISEGQKGRKISDITRKKISNTKKGKPQIHLRKPIIQIEIKTGKIVNKFKKIVDVKKLGFNSYAVQNCLKGTTKTSGGYIWKYA